MKQIGRYILILIGVLVLWNTVIMKPLKLFTVFLHELGHSLMAFIFGYGIQGIRINPNESGHALVQAKGWFSNFLIINGGYLGSVLFALLILYLKRTSVKKFILGTIAIIFLAVSIRYGGFSFTLIYSIIFSGVVLVIYMVHNEKIMDWAIDIIGISSVAYAIYDIFVDTILIPLRFPLNIFGWGAGAFPSDAVRLAKLTHLPAILWGIIWLGIALFAVYSTLLKSSGSKKSSKK